MSGDQRRCSSCGRPLTRTPDDAPDVGLIVEVRLCGEPSYLAAYGRWTSRPMDAQRWQTEADATHVAGPVNGTVRRLLVTGDVLSLDRYADLYPDDSDLAVDGPF